MSAFAAWNIAISTGAQFTFAESCHKIVIQIILLIMSAVRFTIKLRNGQAINVYDSSEIRISDALMNCVTKKYQEKYGRENQRKSSDIEYNCHGLTFISKLGWIGCLTEDEQKLISPYGFQKVAFEEKEEPDVIAEILIGNGLHLTRRIDNSKIEQLTGDEDIGIGDIVIYKDIRNKREEVEHSAVVIEVKKSEVEVGKILYVRVLSKLAWAGEYFHMFCNVPDEYGNIVEFWTDRK